VARLGVFLLGGLALVVSCARPGRPSGGPPDWIPPMVVSTWPDTFEVIEATRKPVLIRFSERLSERPTQGTLDAAVIVSPATAGHRVKLTRDGLEISVLGGLREGLVYGVRVLPTLKDLFGNTLEGPFELVFSTGGEFESNVIAGVARDRITGDPLASVRVEARGAGEEEDGPAYLAFSDTAGVFLLRYVPAGSYRISLFEDVNRNGVPDFRELQAETEGAVGLQAPRADTIIQEVTLLRPDTTPARLIRVEAQDSIMLRLTFDDYLDSERDLDGVEVRLSREEGAGPLVTRLLWERQVDSMRAYDDSVKAEVRQAVLADSLRGVADSLRTVLDSLQAAGDTAAVRSTEVSLERITARLAPPPPEPRGRPTPQAPSAARRPEPEPILPQQSFFALLGEPLPPDEPYQVLVTGVTNLNDLAEGGGEVAVTWTPPDPPPGARRPPGDTVTAPPDTVVVPPDTVVVPPDTVTAPPDTVAAPPDTVVVPSDTVVVPPDTVALPPGRAAFSWWPTRRSP